MNDETITIDKQLYLKLKRDSDFLRRLEAAGVDNWEGYSYAFEDDILDEEDLDETN